MMNLDYEIYLFKVFIYAPLNNCLVKQTWRGVAIECENVFCSAKHSPKKVAKFLFVLFWLIPFLVLQHNKLASISFVFRQFIELSILNPR
jgi:hypothetical protein